MKNTKRTSIITLVLLLSIFKVYSQYMFRHWDVVDGMSDNQIRYFTMAPDGRMVIRTASILNIYNGATFEHFYHDRRKIYKWDFNRNQIFKRLSRCLRTDMDEISGIFVIIRFEYQSVYL